MCLYLFLLSQKNLGRSTKIIMQPFPGPLPPDRYYLSCLTHPFTRLLLSLHSSAKKMTRLYYTTQTLHPGAKPCPNCLWM